MTQKYAPNEVMKRQYFNFLEHADGKSDATIRKVEKSILRFEDFTKFADFKTFNQRTAIAYKQHLTDKDLAKVTILTNMTQLKRFLKWLSRQNGYKSKISVDDVDYLSLSEKDVRAANSPLEKDFPTLAMVRHVVSKMPYATPVERRNRALLTCCALTGARGGALISFRVKHFQKHRMLIVQDPREVNTKFGKLINSFILPVGDDLKGIFLDWIEYLETDALFTGNDPMFPKAAMKSSFDKGREAVGLSREHWATTTPLRTIFEEAFLNAGLPYYSPHRLRDMLVKEMYDRELPFPEFRVWSLSLGHKSPMTTMECYGRMSVHDMERILNRKSDHG